MIEILSSHLAAPMCDVITKKSQTKHHAIVKFRILLLVIETARLVILVNKNTHFIVTSLILHSLYRKYLL